MIISSSISYFYPYLSGLSLHAKRLCEELVKREHKVTVLTNQYSNDLKREEYIDGVEVIRAKPFIKISKGFISFDFILSCLRKIRTSQVVLINLPQFEGIIPAVIGKIFRKKVVCIYHCEVNLPEGFGNKVIEHILSMSNYVSLLLSHKVITYTSDFANHSSILPFFNNKLNFIYPPVYKPKVNKRIQNIFKRKIGDRKYVIGMAVRLSAEKGVEYLLEALPLIKKKLKQEKVIIAVAGPLNPVGEESYKKKIMSIVQRMKDEIVFLGEVKAKDMGSFYSLLDVLILPSINSTEAFGMVQVEAMMMNVPVVASNLFGVRVPLKKTGMGRLVEPKDVEGLAEAVSDILTNKQKYLKNRELINDEFSIEKVINSYEQIIRD